MWTIIGSKFDVNVIWACFIIRCDCKWQSFFMCVTNATNVCTRIALLWAQLCKNGASYAQCFITIVSNIVECHCENWINIFTFFVTIMFIYVECDGAYCIYQILFLKQIHPTLLGITMEDFKETFLTFCFIYALIFVCDCDSFQKTFFCHNFLNLCHNYVKLELWQRAYVSCEISNMDCLNL